MIKLKFNLKFATCVFFLAQIFCAFVILSPVVIASPAAVATDAQKKSLDYYPEVQIPVPGSDLNKASTTVGSYKETNVAGTITGYMYSNLLPRYIRTLYDYGLMIAGILAAIVLMGGGLIWLTSGGDSGKVTQAKELITGSISGLVILLAAWIILNTINPDLINLKAVKTEVVRRATFCCDPVSGNAPLGSGGNCTTGKKCLDGEVCMNQGDGAQTNKFACIDTNSYICCEYEWSANPDRKECIPQLMPNKGGAQCPAKGIFQPTFVYKRSTSGAYCIHSIIAGASCTSATGNCVGKEEGEQCDGSSSLGHCYNDICWFGMGAKAGEPCGNRGGSKCYAGSSCGKDASGKELYHDAIVTGSGRECGDNLRCCNTKS
jgi:hypothetical protein